MRKINSLIFDVSGVLIDDVCTVWKANNDAYSFCGYNIFYSIEDFKKKFKLPIAAFHKANGIPEEMIDIVERQYLKRYLHYQHLIRVFPEAKNVLSELKAMDVELGIASGIPNKFLIEHLHRFQMLTYFDAITGPDDCDEQKPSPKPVLVTLSKLNVSPKNAAYVGDMEEDIVAGKGAGVYTVAVDRSEAYHPICRLKLLGPDYIITDLNDLIGLCQDETQRKN
jgi:HAD superfamily hydrolase (TIGR01549 family)